MEFNFKLKVGDVVQLVKKIESIYKCDDWNAGFYRVERIYPSYGATGKDLQRADCQCYTFEKVRKNGVPYKVKRYYGYRCIAFDKFIADGQAEVVDNFAS